MSNYTNQKANFCFRADSELRGINATIKVLCNMYNAKDADLIATLNADAINFEEISSKNFINVAMEFTPNYFTSSGQICTLKKVYTSDAKFAGFADFEKIDGCDDKGEYAFFKIPTHKWTASTFYNFVKRAYKARDKKMNDSAKLEKKSTSELQAEKARIEAELANRA